MVSQHWFWYWLGFIRYQAGTWTSVYPVLWRHMASPVNNALRHLFWLHLQDVVWCQLVVALWHRSGQKQYQVMACYQVAPSHYLTKCWFIIERSSGIRGGTIHHIYWDVAVKIRIAARYGIVNQDTYRHGRHLIYCILHENLTPNYKISRNIM